MLFHHSQRHFSTPSGPLKQRRISQKKMEFCMWQFSLEDDMSVPRKLRSYRLLGRTEGAFCVSGGWLGWGRSQRSREQGTMRMKLHLQWKVHCLGSAVTLAVAYPDKYPDEQLSEWSLQHILLWDHSLDLGLYDIWLELVILGVITPERHLFFHFSSPEVITQCCLKIYLLL